MTFDRYEYEGEDLVREVKNKLYTKTMKTSKVKTVQSIKPYSGQHGTTYYHNLEMDNGDKINIGKKKECQVGWELTYEIIGDLGQHEFTKAKSVQPEFKPKKNDDYVKGIEVGHAVNNAVNMLCAGLVFDDVDSSLSTENKIVAYAKHILAISEKLKNE